MTIPVSGRLTSCRVPPIDPQADREAAGRASGGRSGKSENDSIFLLTRPQKGRVSPSLQGQLEIPPSQITYGPLFLQVCQV